MKVIDNLNEIRQEIKTALTQSKYDNQPNIIAVTKYVSVERAVEALDAGIKHFGENRIEGFLEKKKSLNNGTMHFIGSLQTRKVKEVINEVDYLHSLDRLSLAKEIQKRADDVVKCFIQVNVSLEESKHGITMDEAIEFAKTLESYDKIEVVGLMTMAPLEASDDEIRAIFKDLKLKQLEVQALDLKQTPCNELSMGMSNDYKIAVEEGATFVRIGTKLVG